MGATIHRSFAYRLHPTAAQAERLRQWIGATRFVYNLCLEQRRDFWRQYRRQTGRHLTWAQQSQEVSELRRQVDWLADVPRDALERALRDLDAAYRAFFAGRNGYPHPRVKDARGVIQFISRDLAVKRLNARWSAIRLPKIGWVKFRDTRELRGRWLSVAVSHYAGQWRVSLAHEIARAVSTPVQSSVGIDRGVTVFAALSTGELIDGPNVGRKAAASLATAQRRLARKKKGSNNRRKARLRVARLQARVAAARKDFLHKISTGLAKSHGVVVLEDLKVRNMTASARGTVETPGRNVRAKSGLNRAILDQGWGMFRQMLAYKLEERGGYLLTVNPKDTSRTCSACGVVDADSRDGTRFACRACGHDAHADHNAAINILRRGTPLVPVELASAFNEAGTAIADADSPPRPLQKRTAPQPPSRDNAGGGG
ncbi:RNA-guided endonuclease InsQ/TnpB family protein [Phenylobacterium kunshanense]|nr:RNA-guided endonuclease TnpB family protein [Phenylobacterium kunshanense]